MFNYICLVEGCLGSKHDHTRYSDSNNITMVPTYSAYWTSHIVRIGPARYLVHISIEYHSGIHAVIYFIGL